MKKFLFLVILSLTLFSCEGPMGPQGPQGVPGEGMFWKYYTYTVKSQDWQLVTSPDGLNTYYMSSKIKILQTICISTDMSWGTWYNLRGQTTKSSPLYLIRYIKARQMGIMRCFGPKLTPTITCREA